jgi:deoxyhypusine synthase
MRARRSRPLPAPIDVAQIRTVSLAGRASKVDRRALARPPAAGMRVADLLAALPDVLAARDLRSVAHAIARRHRAGRLVVLGMGAHPIKVGLGPLIIDLLERGIVSCVAMNGAGIIHDFEMAYQGATSEDVAAALIEGRFGMAEETGRFLNDAIRAAGDEGLGSAVGRAILASRLRHAQLSILAAAARLAVPVTVHVSIGADIIHMHPSADGAAIGAATLRDFHLLAGVVCRLDGGAYVNLGSAVLLPEVFLKALNLARNTGHRVGRLLTVDMDFLRHYRPQVNVVQRPTAPDGRGYQLIGHHEIMFPLLCAAIAEELEGQGTRGERRGKRTAVRRGTR